MVSWATGFFAVAIAAALVGFTGLAGLATEVAVAGKWVFCVGLVLTGVALLRGPRTFTSSNA
jgi:uncharacterized membrane protein YtjA (UPF0391 family)